MKRGLVSGLAIAILSLLLFAVPVAGHDVQSIAGTVDCHGNFSITVQADVWADTHLIVTLGGNVIYDEAIPGDDQSSRTFGPFTGTGAHQSEAITAHTSDSEHVVSGQLVYIGGDCHVDRIVPHAAILGPCGDPMYSFQLINLHSTEAVTFHVSWISFATGARVTIDRTVGAHKVLRTTWKHVLGGTYMRVTARGKVLASETSAAPGSYGPCRTGVA